MKSRNPWFWFTAAILALLLSCQGCAIGPDYTPPETPVPDAWHQALTRGLSEGKADLQTWWQVFEDPLLESLIQRAVQGNLNLRSAVSRIQEARAVRGVAKGDWFPNIDGTGTIQKVRISEGRIEDNPIIPRRYHFYNTGLDSSWEIDIWGRIIRSVESADAGIQASIEDYRDVLVSLFAEVAANYVELRSLQKRIRLANKNIESQAKTLQLTKDRFDAGIASELDIRQAELNLASTESVIPALQTAMVQAVNRLGVLLGQHPSALYDELVEGTPIPGVPETIIVGLPAELLRQRPDIRRAERILAAQTAQIGVAKAELYPRFSLSGTFALDANHSEGFFEGSNRAWGFGPSFRWNLFDGGRIRNNIKIQEARTEQALIGYEQTVLLALEDVENAMVAYVREGNRKEALARSVTASIKSVDLVETLYRSGLTDFQNLLDMQRAQFQQEDFLAQSQGTVVQNLIRIYKSLGGGWATDQTENSEIE